MKRHKLPFLAMLLVSPGAFAQAVDTSNWKCEFCPFEDGYRGDYDVGATGVSDDTAYLGNATGYDESGAYANVDGDGSFTSDSQQVEWYIEDLGLDSRVVTLDGGKQGRYGYTFGWSELPYRRFITTESVHSDVGNATLNLPSDWVSAPTTSGFTALDANLVTRPIQSDRQTLELGGHFNATDSIGLRADYRRIANDGVRIRGGSAFTNATQLAAPFDHVTDEVELGVRWGGNRAFVDFSWYLSDFNNEYDALNWQHPFTVSPGAEMPQLAQAPDNRFQQLRLSGGYTFTEWRTVISASAAVGEIDQTAAFLPYTTNPNVSADSLPRNGLDGSVDTTNVMISLNSRLFRKGRLRMSYRYDERDNQTPIDTYNRVIADAIVSGNLQTNVPYSYERNRFEIVGDYDLFDSLRISGGWERRELDRDFQEVASQEEDIGYGRLRWRPTGSLEFDGRIGTAKRDIDEYNEGIAIAAGQNPLMRKYNMAYRFREFADLRASWAPTNVPIAISFTALYADDDYTKSELGLLSGEENSYTVDFSWFITGKTSLYLNAGVESLESEQAGSESFSSADWLAFNDDEFANLGAGLIVRDIADKFDMRLNLMTSSGESKITIDPATRPSDQFPNLETDLARIDFELVYRRSETMDFTFNASYQQFETSDWQLAGVTPNAVPLLLSLGADPYDEDMFIVGIGVRFHRAPE